MEESYLAELFFKQYKEKNVNIAKTAERKEVTDHRHNGLFQASGYAWCIMETNKKTKIHRLTSTRVFNEIKLELIESCCIYLHT